MPWRIDRFLWVEDEVLVSPHQFEDIIHVFLYVLVFILLSGMGLDPSVVYSKIYMFQRDVVKA